MVINLERINKLINFELRSQTKVRASSFPYKNIRPLWKYVYSLRSDLKYKTTVHFVAIR